jgi:hypothetical protein
MYLKERDSDSICRIYLAQDRNSGGMRIPSSGICRCVGGWSDPAFYKNRSSSSWKFGAINMVVNIRISWNARIPWLPENTLASLGRLRSMQPVTWQSDGFWYDVDQWHDKFRKHVLPPPLGWRNYEPSDTESIRRRGGSNKKWVAWYLANQNLEQGGFRPKGIWKM